MALVMPIISRICPKCKGRGWVFKDILNAATQACACREVHALIAESVIDASKIRAGTITPGVITGRMPANPGIVSSPGPINPAPTPKDLIQPEDPFSQVFRRKMQGAKRQ